MRSALELHDSRIDRVEMSDSNAYVHFSHAYIHKSKRTPGPGSGSGWSQEALLVISNVAGAAQLPSLPDTIAEGHLEVGGIKHTMLPLPFRRKADVSLSLLFADGTSLQLSGRGAALELLGQPIYLEDF